MRHRFATTLAVLTLAALVTIASAQAYAVRTYSLDLLGQSPGPIKLSPNYLSILEFGDAIQSAATGRSDLIQTSVDGRRIILRPPRTTGNTDLIVQVGGHTALFTVEITDVDGMPRRYVIESPEPDEPSPHTVAQAEANAADAESAEGESEAAAGVEGETAPEATSSPEAEAPQRDPGGQAGDLATVSGDDVPFLFGTSVDVRNDFELVFRYTLENQGGHPIANDGTRLVILDENDETVHHTLVRMNPDGTVNRIGAGTTEYGTIRVPRPPSGELRVEWPIVEIGPGTTYTIDEIVARIQ